MAVEAKKSPGRSNYKTGRSFDLTTRCLKVRQGNPCAYCYVVMHRKKGDMFKTEEIELAEYDGFVLRLKQQTIDELNSMGGIRMFSSGDFLRTHRKHVVAFLNDCQIAGLKAKAITKNVHFVTEMHNFQALTCINLSIDLLGPKDGSPITEKLARRLRDEYYKVRVRCVALNPQDLEYYGAQPWVDVITLNHGANGFYRFNEDERARAAEQYAGRMCCLTGKCSTCTVRCGLGEQKMVGVEVKPAAEGAQDVVTIFSKDGCPRCRKIIRAIGGFTNEQGVKTEGIIPTGRTCVMHIPDMTRPEFAASSSWRTDEATELMAALALQDMELPVVRMPDGRYVNPEQAMTELKAKS